MRLDARHLEVLVAIAEAGSIGRAARALHVAQPALTSQLRRIESVMGVRLFERHRAGVTPTEAGQYAVARARELLTAFDDLIQTVHELAQPTELPDAVRVGGVASALVTILVSVLQERFPEREVPCIMEPMVGNLLEQVSSGALDLAVVHEFPGFAMRVPDGVVLRTLLAREPVFAMVPAGHPAAAAPGIDLAELAGEDWVMMSPDDTGLYTRLRILCEAAGFSPRFRHCANDSSAAVALVAEGQAVSGIYATGRELPGVVVLPLVGNPHHRRVALAWRYGAELGDLADELVESLLERYFARAADRPHYAEWLAVHGYESVLLPREPSYP